MIGRYRIVRGKRPPDDPLPDGERQDTRKHTRHVLRPSAELVARFLSRPDTEGFKAFRIGYLALLDERFHADRTPFDALRDLALRTDLFIGCNCPTTKQPDVSHCHTYLALGFLAKHYPQLKVQWP
jgi:hypothetical protein